MLDTGIDVPEVMNLVFFKLVRSKTKFWQMVGRGTRLCPDVFSPGQDKEFFYLFDYCQNLEYFSQDLPATEGRAGESLGKQLFKARLELIGELDGRVAVEDGRVAVEDGTGAVGEANLSFREPKTEAQVRHTIAESLHSEVAAMNVENFVVRQHRGLVEKYASEGAWVKLSAESLAELSHGVAGLPSELETESEEAKRFDLLVLRLQLALLRSEPGFVRIRDKVKMIAGLLEEHSTIPVIQAQMQLILGVQTEEWWQDVTTPMLEVLRRRLRNLVKLIEKQQRKPIYTDFEDVMGDESEVELPGFSGGTEFAKFKSKARAFLREHRNHVTIHKLRSNRPLTASDLAELERILLESGIGDQDIIEHAKSESEGLGIFVRSLIGLDRDAAKGAYSDFLHGTTLNANQIEFVNLIVDHLTEHGVFEAALLYESPFTDLTPQGPEAIFTPTQIENLLSISEQIKRAALAA